MSARANLPFKSVLIANRGEIAVRVIRTARALGLRTIAVYSDADEDAPHVRLADEAHRIGPPPARESYLDIEKLIAVAKASQGRARCIRATDFSRSARSSPKPALRRASSSSGRRPRRSGRWDDKSAAKALMEKARVPVVRGYHGAQQDPKFLRQKAYEIGYPVLIKAAAGGGGKGMRRVDKAIEFDAALAAASREAESAFGDGARLLEKWIERPRHIEVQVFADSHGNAVHLYERDCSRAAPPSEGDRGSARARHQRGSARSHDAGGGRSRAGGRLRRRGHGGVRGERRGRGEARRFLVPGDEHAPSGRASGDRGGDRLRSRRMAIPRCGRRKAAAHPGRNHAFRPCRRGPRLCGGSRSRFSAVDRPTCTSCAGRRAMASASMRACMEGQEVTPYYDPMLAKIIAHGPTREGGVGPARSGAARDRDRQARRPMSRSCARSSWRRRCRRARSIRVSSSGSLRPLARRAAAGSRGRGAGGRGTRETRAGEGREARRAALGRAAIAVERGRRLRFWRRSAKYRSRYRSTGSRRAPRVHFGANGPTSGSSRARRRPIARWSTSRRARRDPRQTGRSSSASAMRSSVDLEHLDTRWSRQCADARKGAQRSRSRSAIA